MKSGESGERLAEMIKKAILDLEVTDSEFKEIMAIAEEDGHIDTQEQNLLSHLHSMIANGTIKRVPD
jgi:hypothetical protein